MSLWQFPQPPKGCGKAFYGVIFMSKLMRFLSYVLVAAVASCLTLALFARNIMADTDKFDEISQIVDYYYIGEADKKAMLDTAAAGYVDGIGDRWSHYMNAEEYRSYKETMNNAYVGIGVTITVREDGYIDVVSVQAGGPAEEAGIQVGDVIVAVSGQDISNMELEEVKTMIRGAVGTKVSVTVRTGETERELQLTRRQIETVVSSGQMLEGNIGLITIVNFDKRCAQETIDQIESLRSQGAKALIFDVRFNPGGYKDELVKLLDYLLPEGPLFRSKDYTGEETVDSSDAKFLDMPMAVLFNDNSYSAAEFFAAALDEYEAAITVGTPTTGKGRFQTSFELSDGSAIVLSIGEYSTPKGVCLAETGLTPDILVEIDEQTYADLYYGTLDPSKDPQIQAAVDALKD